MEATDCGAFDAGGHSIGLSIKLLQEPKPFPHTGLELITPL